MCNLLFCQHYLMFTEFYKREEKALNDLRGDTRESLLSQAKVYDEMGHSEKADACRQRAKPKGR